MFILSIINAAIILLVNSLRIEDAIAAFHSSDFEAVFWISVFLAAVDALAILIILDRPYSKYLYPIELLLYFHICIFRESNFKGTTRILTNGLKRQNPMPLPSPFPPREKTK